MLKKSARMIASSKAEVKKNQYQKLKLKIEINRSSM